MHAPARQAASRSQGDPKPPFILHASFFLVEDFRVEGSPLGFIGGRAGVVGVCQNFPRISQVSIATGDSVGPAPAVCREVFGFAIRKTPNPQGSFKGVYKDYYKGYYGGLV